jgi:hypothetical protein
LQKVGNLPTGTQALFTDFFNLLNDDQI